MFSELLLKPVENLINRGIGQSTEAAKLCAELDGRSISVVADIQPLRIPLNLRTAASDGQIYISAGGDDRADVEIAGTILELNRMMFSESQMPLREGRVRVHGDADIAEQFRTLFLLARPNLEEDLAELVGDEAAPQITRAFRNIRNFAADTLQDVAEQLSGYLKEDGNHLPTPTETERFFGDVDELSNDFARIEARLSRIREKLEKNDQDKD